MCKLLQAVAGIIVEHLEFKGKIVRYVYRPLLSFPIIIYWLHMRLIVLEPPNAFAFESLLEFSISPSIVVMFKISSIFIFPHVSVTSLDNLR